MVHFGSFMVQDGSSPAQRLIAQAGGSRSCMGDGGVGEIVGDRRRRREML